MIVELTKLDSPQIEFDLEIEPEKLGLDIEYVEVLKPVKFEGVLKSKKYWSVIEGDIAAKLRVSCGRCLEPIPLDLDFSFENAYIGAEDFTEERETDLAVENLDVSIIDSDKMDLSEIAGEQISIELNKPIVCKEDCKGLCQKCGTNLNKKDCKCDEGPGDSRWSALSDIKIKK
ncbi:MAG: DUF177 domain-containing protein [Pyrinomonadaceae bacterium]|nr:DUF177 domain-containing protein [Pyrinomonadaceae bacterium]